MTSGSSNGLILFGYHILLGIAFAYFTSQISSPFWFILQARNIQSKEVVAIKKMSFTGKQSSEV